MPFVPAEPGAFGCVAVLSWLYINCIQHAAWLALVLTALAPVQSWCTLNGHWDCTAKQKSFLAVRLRWVGVGGGALLGWLPRLIKNEICCCLQILIPAHP